MGGRIGNRTLQADDFNRDASQVPDAAYFQARGFGVFCALLVLGLSSFEAAAKTRTPKLTCSFIANQCLARCKKEAPAEFCGSYCASNKNMCLRTGEWNGMMKTFSNVVRR